MSSKLKLFLVISVSKLCLHNSYELNQVFDPLAENLHLFNVWLSD